MSYRVLTDASIPYVHSLSGLGQSPSTVQISPSELPWWQQIAIPVGQSVGSAVSQRIAYGQQPYGAYPSGFMYQTPYGQYGGGAYGSFQPSSLLLIGGAALLALMMLRK
jgi:hypothetical protein